MPPRNIMLLSKRRKQIFYECLLQSETGLNLKRRNSASEAEKLRLRGFQKDVGSIHVSSAPDLYVIICPLIFTHEAQL